MSEVLKQTPLYEAHRARGARLVPFAGWEMPIQFAGISSEHQAVRERAGLFDVSHMGELRLRGAGALDAVAELVTNDPRRIQDGRAQYTCCCNVAGGILDDLIVYRLAEDDVLVVCNASNLAKIRVHFETNVRDRCAFEDESDGTALIALQGPRAFEVLKAASPSPEDAITTLPRFGLTRGRVAGVDVLVARTGYTGEDGVELFCSSDEAATLWNGLLESGEPHGLVPVGLGARDTLRLEACLSLYGNELNETTNPFEAGLGWTVKLDKPSFIGKPALSQVAAEPLARRLVGFEMKGRGIARHGYTLLSGGEAVGVCTSGGPSPTLGKSIGLGYVPPKLTDPGTTLQVDCRGRAIEATVVETPFYSRRAR